MIELNILNLTEKNKKGFLLAEETLKVILAVIAIGFLVYLLAAIYFNSTYNQEFEKARASIDRILSVIENPDIVSEDVSDITPPGWNLISYTKEDKPNSCSGESCACICSDTKIDLFDRQLKECDAGGICENVENLEDFGEIKIKKPSISIVVIKSEGKIVIRKNEP